MPEKINVRICVGTTCYVMGGDELLIIKEVLPEQLKDLVSVVIVPCLGKCQKYGASKAPFVEVNGEVLMNCSTTSVLKHLEGLGKVIV